MRALGTVLLGLILVWIFWVVFIANKTKATLDDMQVKVAVSDVEIIKIALDHLWEGYNLEGESGVYTVKSYEEFNYDKKEAKRLLIEWAKEKCIQYRVKPKEINFYEQWDDFDYSFGIAIEVIT